MLSSPRVTSTAYTCFVYIIGSHTFMSTLISYISLAHPDLHSHEFCLYDCLIMIYIYTWFVYLCLALLELHLHVLYLYDFYVVGSPRCTSTRILYISLAHPELHLHEFRQCAWLTQSYTHTCFVYELGSPRVIYTRDFMLSVHTLKVTSTYVFIYAWFFLSYINRCCVLIFAFSPTI